MCRLSVLQEGACGGQCSSFPDTRRNACDCWPSAFRIRRRHSTGIVEICTPVFPAVCVKGSFCGHVCHTACRRRRNVLAVPIAAVLPVVAVGVIIGAVDVIQLACLTEIRGVNRNELAVKRKHIRAQTCYLRHIGMYNTAAVRRISAAKRKPACAVFINADARIERRQGNSQAPAYPDKPAVRREGQTTDLPGRWR